MMPTAEQIHILPSYGYSAHCAITPLVGGLINQTFLVEEGGRRTVLQRLNPIFHPTVHLDIEPITAHLERKRLVTPRLIPTTTGHLWVTDEQGHSWRMLSFVAGRTLAVIDRAETARAAGRLAGQFHSAVSDLEHTFHFVRPGAHDTAAHLDTLRRALDVHRDHARYDAVAAVGARILAQSERLDALPALPRRVVHGDLKASNILFNDAADLAVALLDLDTMAHLTIPVDLGDALRSWCNPSGEDAGEAAFRADLFAAAMEGYAAEVRGFLTADERDSVVLATETIALELAARFCADALNEQYFAWDSTTFASRSEHNQRRAESQLAVAQSVRTARPQLERALSDVFDAA